jgi:DnaD/phage-associated family protein
VSERTKTIFRVEKNADNPFVMIDRRPIENPALSWRAKGILTYLISRPDNWIVRLGDLVKRSPDGVYAVRAALKELTNAGHLTRKEERENGKFKQYVLLVHEVAITSTPTNSPQAVEPHAVLSQAVNLTLNDIDSVNENELNEIEEGRNPLFSLYENNIGMLTPKIADDIEASEKKYTFDWVADSIGLGGKNGAKHFNYCISVLDRWKREGKTEKRPGKKQTAAASGDPSKYLSPEYADYIEH